MSLLVPDTMMRSWLVTTVSAFGLLGLSHLPLLQAFGQTVGPGAILALVFSAIFAPRHAATGSAQEDRS